MEIAELDVGSSVLPLQNYGWLKCCSTATETVGLLGTGAQDGHLDFHTAPELCRVLYNNSTFKTCTRVWCEVCYGQRSIKRHGLSDGKIDK